ncbi:MAG: SGNH/GDSL hydrolase family protein [Ferruginibacter sp.]
MDKTIKTYLALGDSYTIGEGVPLHESFPCQFVQLLRKADVGSFLYCAPEIIAKTGWTTDELDAQVQQTKFLPQYDLVSLLIGVNNQYRGRSVTEFETEFTHLLQLAIQFAGGESKHVIVLSIPDWGVTPFAEGRDRAQLAKEIDAYNLVCKTISENFHCHFIDITSSQRADGNNAAYLAADGLHPSGKEYGKWAMKLFSLISR